MEQFKVGKWGNSLAIRLPTKLVKELNLKEGDFVVQDRLALRRAEPQYNRERVMEMLREARERFPKNLSPGDWKINRNDPDMRG